MNSIIHLETVRLRAYVLVRPAGRLGNCGPVPGTNRMWAAVLLTPRQAANHRLIRARWNAANPGLIAASIDAPTIVGAQS